MFDPKLIVRNVPVLAALVALIPVSGVSGAEEENAGPNVNVVREIAGTLRLQTKSDKRYRGIEEWRIFVHRDGSRTMMMSKNFVARNSLQVITAYVDADFRPIDVYASYWIPDGYRGSIRVALDGSTLRAVSEGPGGQHSEEIEVPHYVSVVTHGEAMNGWYLWQGERDAEGKHQASSFILSPYRYEGDLVRGRLDPGTFRYLGKETVTVPAGTFECDHYLLANIEIWSSGEDRILVRQEITDEDKEYVLTRLEHAITD